MSRDSGGRGLERAEGASLVGVSWELPDRISVREVDSASFGDTTGMATPTRVRAPGADLAAMISAAAQAELIVGHTLPSQVLRAGPRTRTIPAETGLAAGAPAAEPPRAGAGFYRSFTIYL